MYKFPNNKKFAFTIIDDTDDSYLENIEPIYDLLKKNGIKTSKTVWVFPVRDTEKSKGDSLSRFKYADFVRRISKEGYEIALHNVGSGNFERKEIKEGLKIYEEKLGFLPRIHINHSYNPDNIYCGSKRFSFPLNYFVKKLYSHYSNFSGEDPSSKHFWGDLHKSIIDFSRNYEIDNINTGKINPYMPYKDKSYDEYSNYWFSSTFAPNQWIFNHQVNRKTIDKLEREGGLCILYTHLGYFIKDGVIDPKFKETIEYLGSKKNCWFTNVSNLLDFLIEHKKDKNINEYIPRFFKKRLELKSLITRIKYRYFVRIDDYHFKRSNAYEHYQKN